VPLDDTAPPGGPTIRIALARVRATDPDRRIGSLVVNPGGPGASGVDFVRDAAALLPPPLRERFDIVGFDPRGVARTARIDCTDRLDPYYAVEFAPDDAAERAALEAQNRRLVAACERRAGKLLPFVSTERTARDLDRIRAALGDDRLTYLGFSYGTYLGTLYADRFPDRVRALVLDGAIDPVLDGSAAQVQQAVGFEHSLDAFLADCADQRSCSFHRRGRSAAAYDRLRARVGREPIPAEGQGDGRTLNGTTFDIGVTQLLYGGRDEWSLLADALDAAAHGDGSDLLAESDFYTGRLSDGTYDDTYDAFLAIGCLDGPDLGGVDNLRAIEEQAAVAAPRLGRTIVNNSFACALWPVPTVSPTVPRALGAPPILVLGARNDPATPFAQARALADELESGVLIAVDSDRHTSFAGDNACVDRLVARYLVRLAVPRDGTKC
jgi:pimeloyl-ACP methyl ester carboxylesterase